MGLETAVDRYPMRYALMVAQISTSMLCTRWVVARCTLMLLGALGWSRLAGERYLAGSQPVASSRRAWRGALERIALWLLR